MLQQVTVGASWVGIMVLNVYKCQRCKQLCILDYPIQLERSGSQMKARQCVRKPACKTERAVMFLWRNMAQVDKETSIMPSQKWESVCKPTLITDTMSVCVPAHTRYTFPTEAESDLSRG